MKFLTLILAVMLMVGCATTQWPDCNKDFAQTAVVRQIADQYQLCLQDVGTGLILANGAAISYAKSYTAKQALVAVDEWVNLLKMPTLTLLAFKTVVADDIKSFPELIEITSVFETQFDSPAILDAESRKILTNYLMNRVRPILVLRVDLEDDNG